MTVFIKGNHGILLGTFSGVSSHRDLEEMRFKNGRISVEQWWSVIGGLSLPLLCSSQIISLQRAASDRACASVSFLTSDATLTNSIKLEHFRAGDYKEIMA